MKGFAQLFLYLDFVVPLINQEEPLKTAPLKKYSSFYIIVCDTFAFSYGTSI